jgi:hypothetical protein
MTGKKNVYIESGDDGKYPAKHAHDGSTGIVTETQREAIEADCFEPSRSPQHGHRSSCRAMVRASRKRSPSD